MNIGDEERISILSDTSDLRKTLSSMVMLHHPPWHYNDCFAWGCSTGGAAQLDSSSTSV